MDIAQQASAEQLLAALIEPAQGIAQKEPLQWRQPADLLAFLVLFCFFESIQSKQNSAVVRDVFTKARLAVDMQSRQRFVLVELFHHELGALLKLLCVFLRPPFGEISSGVVLPSFVIEAMRDFVADRRCAGV